MTTILLIVRLGLGVVLATAGAGKLVRLDGTRATLRDFGVPERALGPGALALPLAELVCAGLLVPRPTARVGAAVAGVLLAAFTIAVARVLARGERPECNCFGALGSAPVSRWTLARNAGLLAVAGFALVGGPGRGIAVSLSGTDGLVLGIGAGLLVLGVAHAFFTYQLFRQNGRLLERISVLEAGAPDVGVDGLPVGAAAPYFELPDLDDQLHSLDDLMARGAPLALGFVDPNCAACGPALAQLAAARSDALAVAILTRGEADSARRKVGGHRFDAVLLERGNTVAEAYRVTRVPSVQLIDAAGRIAGPLATGDEAIVDLIGLSAPASLHVVGVAG